MAFYHKITYWRDGVQVDRIVGSDAATFNDAHHERCKLERQYHRNTLIAASTHGTKPATCRYCGEPLTAKPNRPEAYCSDECKAFDHPEQAHHNPVESVRA
jgi:hypothetical protein